MKGEWLYEDFGRASITATDPSGFATFESHGDVKGNIIRVGLDYKF